MGYFSVRQIPFPIAVATICALAAAGPSAALDTLRIGMDGNITWTGKTLGGSVNAIPPEYKVSQHRSEVGNTPGNLIPFSHLDDTAPTVLLKTAAQVSPARLAGQLRLINTLLLEAVTPLSGVTRLDTISRGNLSTVVVRFLPGEDLSLAVRRVGEAVDAIRAENAPVESQGDGYLPAGTNPVVLPVALSPDHIARGENVAQRALGWGGNITAPAITDVPRAELQDILLKLIQPGGAEEAFERKGARGALGTFIVLDLGAPVGINRIRFYPRNTVQSAPNYPFQNDFLRQFELMLHDGQNLVLDGTGQLVPQRQHYQTLMRTTNNEQPIVDVPVIPPRLTRYVRLQAISSIPYEINKLEVFGQGFISKSRYLSPVYDLGAPATWGNISWVERFVDVRDRVDEIEDIGDLICEVESQLFEHFGDITPDWGECITRNPYIPGRGYVNMWECFRTRCRDRQTGEVVSSTPGRGKRVSAAKAAISAGESKIIVRTRTGRDPNPLRYYRRNVQQTWDPEEYFSLINPGQPLERNEYLALNPRLDDFPPFVWAKGRIEDDLENWSPWSAPYRDGHRPGGAPILSPGPRRYIQFSVEFENNDIDATKMLEHLEIEYLLPPIADDLIAEIFPREVDTSETVPFTYAVRALMNMAGVKGFDTFQISTPTWVEGIDRIEIRDGQDLLIAQHALDADIILGEEGAPLVQLGDGSRHALPYQVVSALGDTFAIQQVTERNFTVQFPHISKPVVAGGGQKVLYVFFRTQVLLYSTLFRGEASLSSAKGSIQRITPGDAAFLGEGDLPTASGITVLNPAINRGSLIGSLTLQPNPFTPNDDGINDLLGIEYSLLAVTREVAVDVQIFDLSGRLMRELYRGEQPSGRHVLVWDGRNAHGGRVPPGIYLLHIQVKGDARESREIRPAAVIY